ncbi:hypothetical protein STEG23_022946, partial [Scotinomys teguina]
QEHHGFQQGRGIRLRALGPSCIDPEKPVFSRIKQDTTDGQDVCVQPGKILVDGLFVFMVNMPVKAVKQVDDPHHVPIAAYGGGGVVFESEPASKINNAVFPSVDHLTSHKWAMVPALAAEAPVRDRANLAKS